MRQKFLSPLLALAMSLGAVACSGNSHGATADSTLADTDSTPADASSPVAEPSADSLAALEAQRADSVAQAQRTQAEIDVITQLYASPLLEYRQGLSAGKKLSRYCSPKMLSQLKQLYKQGDEIMLGDPAEGYLTEAFTSGNPNGYDGDHRIKLISVDPLGDHRYAVTYRHLGGKHTTQLQMTTDENEPKVDKIIKRAR